MSTGVPNRDLSTIDFDRNGTVQYQEDIVVRILLMNQHLPIVEVYELPNSHKGTRDNRIIRHQALRANGFGHPMSPTGA